MFISDFAIRRPIITVVVTIALVVFGIAALARLQTDEFPDIDAPVVFIGIVYPGASPEQVEREVVDRLEDRISGISGLDKLNSTSSDGFAQIIIQFKFDKPTDEATQDVRDAIAAVRAQLSASISQERSHRSRLVRAPGVEGGCRYRSLDSLRSLGMTGRPLTHSRSTPGCRS